jgi:hypothetical protein
MSEEIITKRCSRCKGEPKPVSQFHKNRTTKDGYAYWCKSCCQKYFNTERSKASHRKYEQSEKRKATTLKYQQTPTRKKATRLHAAKYAKSIRGQAKRKAWRQSQRGKESHRLAIAKQYQNNPEKVKARKKVTHAVESGQLPKIFTMSCHYCSKPATNWHHWKGYALEHALDVVPACRICDIKHH